MKLTDLKPAKKPFIITPRLTVSVLHIKKRIQEFEITIDGEMKKFPVKAHNYLDTLKKVIKYIESKL